MIAKQNDCDPQRLASVLSDRGNQADQTWAERHLDQCLDCRQRLEELTAEPQWWNETRSVLRTVTLTDQQPVHHQPTESRDHQAKPISSLIDSSPIDSSQSDTSASMRWVLGLLEKQPTTTASTQTPTSAAPVIGTIDGMPISSVVGQGGMGVVLRGFDQQLHRPLAIKLLSPMLASSGAARQRFLREAQAAASVVHPNIVPIYAVSTERDVPYLVMPFVSGGNLQQVIDREGPLPLERVLNIGVQVAEGLAAAHRQGIVHRDIKPANLMLDEGGFRILITDFGLARAADDMAITASGMVAGTPQFMSPEQARGDAVDHRSDLYSLGAVLYNLSTGRPPIVGSSTLDVLHRIAQQTPRSVIEFNEQLPLWFERLIQWLMAKPIDERMTSAEQAAVILRGALSHARAPHRSPLPTELRKHDHWRRISSALQKRSTKRLASVLLVLVVSLALLPWLNSNWLNRPTRPQYVYPQQTPAPESAITSQPVPATDNALQHDRPSPQDANELAWDNIELRRLLDQTRIQLEQLQQALGIQPSLTEPSSTLHTTLEQGTHNDDD